MTTKIYDVCTKRVYEKNGEKKIKWYRAGILKETEQGTRFIRMFNQPETDLFVFEKENPEDAPTLQEK